MTISLNSPENLISSSSKMVPIVSVIVPVYNVAAYLRVCLDCLRGQTLRNIEVICVNDGSTDQSRDILSEYASADLRIQIVDQENRGLSEARNAGARVSSGKYLYFMDSDDLLEPDALELLVSDMEERALEFLCFNAIAFGEDPESEKLASEKNRDYFQRKLDERRIYTGRDLFLEMKTNPHNHFVTPVWTSMILRAFFLKENIWFYPGILHEDELWTFSVLMRAQRVGCLNKTLYHYRVRKSSIMTESARFAHAYGCFICSREIQSISSGLDLSSDSEFNSVLLEHAGKLQRNAVSKYRKCSLEEKERRLLLPMEDRSQFEGMVAFPASLEDRNSLAEAEIKQLRSENKELKEALEAIRASKSFRIGRAVTWLPRKARGCML